MAFLLSRFLPFPSNQKFAAPPTLPENINTQSSGGWDLYHNTKYGFSFKYPANFDIESDNEPASNPDDGSEIAVASPLKAQPGHLPQWLGIIIQSRDVDVESYSLPSALWSGPVTTLADSIWRLAKFEGTATSPVVTTTLGGEVAYMFTVTDGVGVNGRGYAIDTENQWMFLKRNNVVFEVALPNTQEFVDVLNTFQFDK